LGGFAIIVWRGLFQAYKKTLLNIWLKDCIIFASKYIDNGRHIANAV